jgi:hypothetical protein
MMPFQMECDCKDIESRETRQPVPLARLMPAVWTISLIPSLFARLSVFAAFSMTGKVGGFFKEFACMDDGTAG